MDGWDLVNYEIKMVGDVDGHEMLSGSLLGWDMLGYDEYLDIHPPLYSSFFLW